MANIIESFGYSLGKVHVGMLVYLCDLFREGITEPLTTALAAFEVPVPGNPIPRREWKIGPRLRVDLAIFDGLRETPSIVIEVKVDDYEGVQGDVWQTTLYSDATPHDTQRLFITLGNGEFYRPPDSRFKWIRLPDLFQAINAIVTPEPLIRQWRDALQNELDRRQMVSQDIRDHLHLFRAGSWNIIFLGQLKEILQASLDNRSFNIEPTCYTHGTRPDTILNFGWNNYPRYTEINNNGRLNVKITFEDRRDDAERRALYEETVTLLKKALADEAKDIRGYNPGSKTMTVLSIDIGLSASDGALEYRYGQGYTVGKLRHFLEVLYGD